MKIFLLLFLFSSIIIYAQYTENDRQIAATQVHPLVESEGGRHDDVVIGRGAGGNGIQTRCRRQRVVGEEQG